MHTTRSSSVARASARLGTATAYLLLARAAVAHPGLDERIAQVTADITAQPAALEPRLERAELYRQHGQFNEALADLAVAEAQPKSSNAVMLARAEVFYTAGETTNALANVQQFIACQTNDRRAFLLRARCRFKLQQVEAAVADYAQALAKTPRPEPDLLLEMARAQAALGRFSDAVKGLDDGMARLGEVPTLELAAIEYERAQAAFDAALTRVDKLTRRYPVPEPWLVLRGEILEQAGRPTDARAAFDQALAGIHAYPPARRSLDLTQQLETRGRAGLTRVEHKLSAAAQSTVSAH